jgi:hypothetical protein
VDDIFEADCDTHAIPRSARHARPLAQFVLDKSGAQVTSSVGVKHV